MSFKKWALAPVASASAMSLKKYSLGHLESGVFDPKGVL